MKTKLSFAVILLGCFLWLAVLTGTVPLSAEASAAESPEPSADISPSDTPSPIPASPSVTAENALPAAESDTETPPADDSLRILSATITGELLENETDYDIDPQALLDAGPKIALEPDGYQILIIHTHGTEAYTPTGTDTYPESDLYRTTDTTKSVIRVGSELTAALESYGLRILHDTALYDYPSYNGSYTRCAEAISEYLTAYPSIHLVIDLHRDALGEGDTIYKTVADAAGTQCAQLMFVMGSDVNLEHPLWRDNLSLALTLQNAALTRYPELMRPTVLCAYRYNQQLTAGSMLLEVGTAGNTLQEAITAVQLFADAAAPVLLEMTDAP